ncbi:hypothetical protein ABE504_06625 [Paenibacillus oryzisoli]|uniref:hypothetical protein n=1 Tax=Paenibacillus oryzisoli TaxID=1850517 RepID=UPI003D2CF4C9
MSLMSSKRNQAIAGVIVILALVMVYINFVAPVHREQEARAKLLTQMKQELEALTKRTEGGSTLGAEEQVSLSKARTRVPEAPDLEGLIRDVHMLEVITKMPLASYNFEIGKAGDLITGAEGAKPVPTTAVQASTVPQEPNLKSLAIPIKLNTSAKGDYAQIHRFLDELQTANRLIQVDKLTFAVKSAPPIKLNAPKREITVNVSLMSYYAPGLQKFFKNPVSVPYDKPSGKNNPLY